MRKGFNKLNTFLFLGDYDLKKYFGDDYLLTKDSEEVFKIIKERNDYCHKNKLLSLDDSHVKKVIVFGSVTIN